MGGFGGPRHIRARPPPAVCIGLWRGGIQRWGELRGGEGELEGFAGHGVEERGELGVVSGEVLLGGEDLEAGVLGGGAGELVVAVLFAPLFGSGIALQGEEDSELGIVAAGVVLQVAALGGGDAALAGFDFGGDGLLFDFAASVGDGLVERADAVKALLIAAIVRGEAGDGADGPVLVLKAVEFGEFSGFLHSLRDSEDVVFRHLEFRAGCRHDSYGRGRYVNANPAASQIFSSGDCRAAAAERIEDKIARIGRSLYDALQKSNGFLRGITETLISSGRLNIRPDILSRNAFGILEILFVAKRAARFVLYEQAVSIHLLHSRFLESPRPLDAPKLVRSISTGFICARECRVFATLVFVLVVLGYVFLVVGKKCLVELCSVSTSVEKHAVMDSPKVLLS